MSLKLAVGQHSDAGRKPLNQDFHGVARPTDAQRRSRGIALAIADGISTSAVSQVASAAAVRGFLEDYYGTSEAWTVRRAAQCVLAATNAWLHAESQRTDHPARLAEEEVGQPILSRLFAVELRHAVDALANLLVVGDCIVSRLFLKRHDLPYNLGGEVFR